MYFFYEEIKVYLCYIFVKAVSILKMELKRVKTISLLTSFVFILFTNQIVLGAKRVAQKKDSFGFVYQCNNGINPICLLGEFDKGLFVFLLNRSNSLVCTATSGDQGKEDSTYGSIDYTELINLVNCEKPEDYSIAFIPSLENKWDIDTYENIPLNQIGDPEKINALNEMVHKTNVLQSLLDRTAGIEGLYKVSDEIAKSPPQALEYPIPGSKVYILTYELSWKLSENKPLGPRVIIINNSVQALTGQCSYRNIRGFKLIGRYYLESGSHCCECGITGQELFKIEGSKATLVYEDFSFSD